MTGAHGVRVGVDGTLRAVRADAVRLVVLPGGMPGATNLAACAELLELLQAVHAHGGTVAAICAGPIVLAAAGLLRGRRATCYPGFEDQLTGATVTEAAIEVDDNVHTSRGPGTAMAFALHLVAEFGDPGTVSRLREAMLLKPPDCA